MDNNHDIVILPTFDVVVTDVMSPIEPKEIMADVIAMFCNG